MEYSLKEITDAMAMELEGLPYKVLKLEIETYNMKVTLVPDADKVTKAEEDSTQQGESKSWGIG